MFLAWTNSVMYLLTNSIIESFLSSVRQSKLGMPGFTLRRVVCGALIFNCVLELGIMLFIVKVLVCWSDVYKWKKIKNGWRKGISCFPFPFVSLFDNYSLRWEGLRIETSYSLIPFSVNGSTASAAVCSSIYWLCVWLPRALCHTRVCGLHAAAAAACMVCWLDARVRALARWGSLAHCSLCSFVGKKILCLWSASCF